MLSKLIDKAYFKLRYAIWGPEVPFVDGTVIPEGRPPEDRKPYNFVFRTLDFQDAPTSRTFYDQVKEG